MSPLLFSLVLHGAVLRVRQKAGTECPGAFDDGAFYLNDGLNAVTDELSLGSPRPHLAGSVPSGHEANGIVRH